MTSGSLFFTKMLFYPFLTQYYNGKERKYFDFSYITNITRTSLVCQAIRGPDLFGTKKGRKWPQDHYFSQKVLFCVFLTLYYNRKEGKDLDFSYTANITRTSRVWQAI